MIEPDWQSEDGSVRLYCGDCLKVLPTLDGVDAVVTDPPWNCGYFGESDKVDWGQYRKYLGEWKNAADICDGQCWFLSTKSIAYVSDLFVGWNAFASTKNFSQMAGGSLPNCWDIAWLRSTDGAYLENGRNWFLANTAGMLKDRTEHPTPRTKDVMRFVLSMFKWDTICDPFMGSGTTGVACVNTGRKFIGIEIDRGYFDIAVKRIKDAIDATALFAPPVARQEQLAFA